MNKQLSLNVSNFQFNKIHWIYFWLHRGSKEKWGRVLLGQSCFCLRPVTMAARSVRATEAGHTKRWNKSHTGHKALRLSPPQPLHSVHTPPTPRQPSAVSCHSIKWLLLIIPRLWDVLFSSYPSTPPPLNPRPIPGVHCGAGLRLVGQLRSGLYNCWATFYLFVPQ